jgi:hypothetical protein
MKKEHESQSGPAGSSSAWLGDNEQSASWNELLMAVGLQKQTQRRHRVLLVNLLVRGYELSKQVLQGRLKALTAWSPNKPHSLKVVIEKNPRRKSALRKSVCHALASLDKLFGCVFHKRAKSPNRYSAKPRFGLVG